MIELIFKAYVNPGDEIIMSDPSFIMYRIACQIFGGNRVAIPLDNYSHKIEAISRAINHKTKIIIIDNPINPTGTIIQRDVFQTLIENVPEHVILVIDEAYREYITDDGNDSQLDEDYTTVQERVRHLDWSFDPTGGMVEWLDGEDSTGNIASNSFGRALGYIKNGYQLNVENSGGACMNALADADEMPPGCLKPEAIYFASNTDEVGPGKGPVASVWRCRGISYLAQSRLSL